MSSQELDVQFLLYAYCLGYFPMPDPLTQEILWYRPDPRAVIPLDGLHVSRSLQRHLSRFTWTIDRDFSGVMAGCRDRPETWINDVFLRTYGQLHALGFAHSVEVWQGDRLVGGLYGVAIGGAFFAESMFHRVTDASKAALKHLVDHLNARHFALLEVQFLTPHLQSLGAKEVSGAVYEQTLAEAVKMRCDF